MREAVEGSCVLCHCQVHDAARVPQYLGCPVEWNGNEIMWFLSMKIGNCLLVLSAAFESDVVNGDDLVTNFDFTVLKYASVIR